jgi:hypothetical protein
MKIKPIACVLLLCAILGVRAGAAESWEPANTSALVVGVLRWEGKGLPTFPARNRKDQELHATLLKCGVHRDDAMLLLDERATLANIRAGLESAARRARPGSTLIVYYAGHGLIGKDGVVRLAGYDSDPRRVRKTALAVSEITAILSRHFKGRRVLLLADCCRSGALAEVARGLAAAGVKAASLTSADDGSQSTESWLFTQTLVDGLNGDPGMDADGDGAIRLGEVAAEATAAMKYREGQRSGYAAHGVAADFKLVSAARAPGRPAPREGPFALREYVLARDGDKQRPGRVVGREGEDYVVEFYDYTDKRRVRLPASGLAKIRLTTFKAGETVNVSWDGAVFRAKVVRVEGDFHRVTFAGWPAGWDEWVLSTRIVTGPVAVREAVQVEWEGEWWPAVVLKAEGGRYRVHYVGYAESWDEWVTAGRVRFPTKTAPPSPATPAPRSSS